jgi:hypothetical protein
MRHRLPRAEGLRRSGRHRSQHSLVDIGYIRNVYVLVHHYVRVVIVNHRWCETPRSVIHPGVAPWCDICPVAIVIGRLASHGHVWEQNHAVTRQV